jgi:hypothetical protein
VDNVIPYDDGEIPFKQGDFIVALPAECGDKNGSFDSADLVGGQFISRSDDRVRILDHNLGIEREFTLHEVYGSIRQPQ